MNAAAKKLEVLEQALTECRRCPRLVEWRERIAREKTKRFSDWQYWGRPVPAWGDARARLLIVGLAPAAHGANRTGRMFTGDRSGDWLYRALHKAGFANQPTSEHCDDGLTLTDCWITAPVRCAPPDNKPLPEEFANCHAWLMPELRLLQNVKVVLALGGIGFDRALRAMSELHGLTIRPKPKFKHGAMVELKKGLWMIGSMHPSQQNTFTGRLTEPMFDAVFAKAREILEAKR